MGIGLHTGIEKTPADGVKAYHDRFYVINDSIINWSIQIEHWATKVKKILPKGGQHEASIFTEEYVGFIDYVTSDTIYDFKFTKPTNYNRYLRSRQLHVYKHYWEKQNPGVDIKHLKYVFVPKCQIRQKKTESIQQFRNRLYEELNGLKVEVIEVPFDKDMVTQFTDDCNRLESVTEYPKNESPLCQWCDYRDYCLLGEDWMLL